MYAASMPEGDRNCPSHPLADVEARIDQSGHGRGQCKGDIDDESSSRLPETRSVPGPRQLKARARNDNRADASNAPIVSP